MKKFILFSLIFLLTLSQSFAEQYLLQCNLNIEAVNTATEEIMNRSTLERFFIIDTVLAEVYDANNLPLDVEKFTEEEIVFHHKAASFNTIVETQVTYNQVTKKIKLNEIYGNNAYSNRAQFVTRGEGTCTVTQIERKPIF